MNKNIYRVGLHITYSYIKRILTTILPRKNEGKTLFGSPDLV